MLNRLVLFLVFSLLLCAQTPPETEKKSSAIRKESPSLAIQAPDAHTLTIPQPFVMKSEGGPQPSPWTTWGPFVASGISVFVSLGTVFLTQRSSRRILEQQNAHAIAMQEKQHHLEWSRRRDEQMRSWKRDFYIAVAANLCDMQDRIVQIHLLKKNFNDESLSHEIRKHFGDRVIEDTNAVNNAMRLLTERITVSKGIINEETYSLIQGFRGRWVELLVESKLGTLEGPTKRLISATTSTLASLADHCEKEFA